MRIAINLVYIRKKALLLLRKRDVWILPGGKPNILELDHDCLKRENQEELPGSRIVIGRHYRNFKGKTPHTKDILLARVFLGSIRGDTSPSAEISEARFFTAEEFSEIPISEITKKVIRSLIKDKLL